jgi:hypothetical protein
LPELVAFWFDPAEAELIDAVKNNDDTIRKVRTIGNILFFISFPSIYLFI